MQLAPDNRIYICTWNGNYSMHYIEYPDSTGIKCNVVQNGIHFTAPNTGGGLPMFPFYNLGSVNIPATVTGANRYIYNGDTTQLGIPTSGYTYNWQPTQNMDNPQSSQPRVWPTATTIYTVTVSDTLNRGTSCATQTYTVEVQIVEQSIHNLPGTPNIIVPTFITDATTQWAIINKPPVISATLYNVLGQNVFHADNYNNDFDARTLSNGIYIYVLQTPDGHIWKGKLEVMR